MLVDTLECAAHCSKLFTSFRIRGLYQSDEEFFYTEENISFLDEIRLSHPGIQQPTLLIADVFVSGLESPRSRPNLQSTFRFSCLCLDEPRLVFSPVKFGSPN